ncbi:MAG: hypothetical protein KTR20_05815 [Cellvibrionaceae bacterium]|nr:hypothetical protein [Cellvibrionaceae bacterium]
MIKAKNDNIVNFSLEDKSLPCDVDSQLHKVIIKYLSVDGRSYSTLARDIDRFVRNQYEWIWNLVEEGKITQAQLEKHMKDHTPSRSYLHDYVKGRPICFRYTNTIANFFNINYSISNFNPPEDLQALLKMTQ